MQRNVFFLQCNVFLLQCKVSPHVVFYEVKPTFRGSGFLHRNLFWLQCKVLGPVMQNIAPQCFFVALVCCTANLFVALFRAAFLHVKLHFFRKQPQAPTVGPGGVPEEPPRNSGGTGRCPANNHESGLPRIMVTQGVPEGYGGVARLLEGPHEVLEGFRWDSWQVPDCENI